MAMAGRTFDLYHLVGLMLPHSAPWLMILSRGFCGLMICLAIDGFLGVNCHPKLYSNVLTWLSQQLSSTMETTGMQSLAFYSSWNHLLNCLSHTTYYFRA